MVCQQSVQQGGEGVPLVVVAGTPEDHDDTEDHGEEKVPECLPFTKLVRTILQLKLQ